MRFYELTARRAPTAAEDIYKTIFGLVVVLIAYSMSISVGPGFAVAQEVSFTPRYDGISQGSKKGKAHPTTATPEARPAQLYSFARFKGRFQEVCRLLEADGRRERVFSVSKVAGDEERDCSSCRAFFKQMAQSCAPIPKVKNAIPTKSSEGAVEADEPTAAEPLMVQERYPRTELVEVVSRLSEGLYEFNPGRGAVLDALRSFEGRLLGMSDLTPGERDYFGIFLAYLFSAWEGRFDSPLETPTPSPDEIARLFQ